MGRVELEIKMFFSDNFRQNFVDKFKKITIVGFSLESFTADFLRLSSTTIRICFLGDLLGTRVQFETFQGSSWHFLIFQDSIESRTLSEFKTFS